jgi:hypothetical protein
MEDEDDLAQAIRSVGRAIDRLGNADAMTPMGGLEALGKVLSESIDGLAAAMHDVAEAIREHDNG